MNTRFTLEEVVTGLRRTFTLTVAIVVTSAIAFSLLAFALLTRSEVRIMETDLYQRVEISVFLCSDISPQNLCELGAITTEQKSAIEQRINSLKPLVTEIRFEDQARAYARFMEQFAGSAVAQEATVDQMPESFRVSMADPLRYKEVVNGIQNLSGVEYVQDQQEVLDSLFVLLNYLQLGAVSLAGLMLLVVMVLIANSMRIAAFSRKDEIGIMRLVGASKASIRLPFVLEALIASFLGGLIAFGLLAAFQYWVVEGLLTRTIQFLNFVTWTDLYWAIGIATSSGLMLTGLAAFISIRRHLKV
jgi:cell division transport system permease protein